MLDAVVHKLLNAAVRRHALWPLEPLEVGGRPRLLSPRDPRLREEGVGPFDLLVQVALRFEVCHGPLGLLVLPAIHTIALRLLALRYLIEFRLLVLSMGQSFLAKDLPHDLVA